MPTISTLEQCAVALVVDLPSTLDPNGLTNSTPLARRHQGSQTGQWWMRVARPHARSGNEVAHAGHAKKLDPHDVRRILGSGVGAAGIGFGRSVGAGAAAIAVAAGDGPELVDAELPRLARLVTAESMSEANSG